MLALACSWHTCLCCFACFTVRTSPYPPLVVFSWLLCDCGCVQNVLLQGPDARRVVSLKAETDVLLRVCNRELFDWFLRDRPHAVVAFVLTTTCRQWRVAYTTLVDTLGTECRQPLSPCSISLLHLPSPSPFSIS